jgi:hypothetical protein
MLACAFYFSVDCDFLRRFARLITPSTAMDWPLTNDAWSDAFARPVDKLFSLLFIINYAIFADQRKPKRSAFSPVSKIKSPRLGGEG